MTDTAFIGIDAGGSRLRVAAERAGRKIAFECPGVNLRRDGMDVSSERIGDAVKKAASGLDGPATAIVVAGVAGALDTVAAEQLRTHLLDRVVRPRLRTLHVLSDVWIAHHSVHGNGPGITVVAGTGSVVFSRDASGNDHVVGGWGYRLGDEGSGYAIGVSALRSLTRAIDRGGTSAFEELVQTDNRTSLRSSVLQLAYEDSSRIQALAPHVLKMAEADVPEAVDVVTTQIELLANNVVRVKAATIGAPSRILLTGGLSDNPYYVSLMANQLRSADPGLEIAVQPVDSVTEALRIAKSIPGGTGSPLLAGPA